MPETKRATDPVYRHSLREGLFIGALWLACTLYCCLYCYVYGYIRPGRNLGVHDIEPTLGMPSWVFWGILAPWFVCGIVNILFSLFFMKEDDLGIDHAVELERDIRERGMEE